MRSLHSLTSSHSGFCYAVDVAPLGRPPSPPPMLRMFRCGVRCCVHVWTYGLRLRLHTVLSSFSACLLALGPVPGVCWSGLCVVSCYFFLLCFWFCLLCLCVCVCVRVFLFLFCVALFVQRDVMFDLSVTCSICWCFLFVMLLRLTHALFMAYVSCYVCVCLSELVWFCVFDSCAVAVCCCLVGSVLFFSFRPVLLFPSVLVPFLLLFLFLALPSLSLLHQSHQASASVHAIERTKKQGGGVGH